jgi:hypothetical protein
LNCERKTTTDQLKRWQIKTSDGKAVIAVSACDRERANITVFLADKFHMHRAGGQVMHTVSVPDLVREWKRQYRWDMPADLYDKYLRDNKGAVLSLIEQLNAPEYPADGKISCPAEHSKGVEV